MLFVEVLLLRGLGLCLELSSARNVGGVHELQFVSALSHFRKSDEDLLGFNGLRVDQTVFD